MSAGTLAGHCRGALSLVSSKNAIISAVANTSTAYNLTIVAYALVIMDGTWPDDEYASGVKTAALVGAIVGQLTFGYVGDCLGRSKAMFLTMLFSLGGALLSAAANDAGHNTPYPWLIASRAILGIGVGGVYPLAATVAAESSGDEQKRGRHVSAVFSFQGIGFLLCPAMVLLSITIFPAESARLCEKRGGTPDHYALGRGCNDASWRLVLALGALPGLLLLPFRTEETGTGTSTGTGAGAGASSGTSSAAASPSLWRAIADRRHWRTLAPRR